VHAYYLIHSKSASNQSFEKLEKIVHLKIFKGAIEQPGNPSYLLSGL